MVMFSNVTDKVKLRPEAQEAGMTYDWSSAGDSPHDRAAAVQLFIEVMDAQPELSSRIKGSGLTGTEVAEFLTEGADHLLQYIRDGRGKSQ